MNDSPQERDQEMQALLEGESAYHSLHRGDVIEGTIIGIGRDGILVNIGSKSEGIIPPHEMQSLGAQGADRLAEGQTVVVYVLQPETEEGQVLLSLDRARGEQGWRDLQKRFEDGETFEAEVTGYNKGGLLVNVDGVNAFVPLSQLVGVRPPAEGETESALANNVGRPLRLKVIEINRRRNRVILSERAALQEWRSLQKDRLLAELTEGSIRRGKVTSIRSFGVFIDMGGADGLAHLSELSWDRNQAPQDLFHVGDEVDVYVMKVDPETKKIALSIRRAQPQQWDEIVDNYHVGQLVGGQVTKLVTFGAFARLDGPVEGLIHVSELADRRIQHPREVVQEGDIVPLRVVRIERDRHRLGLSLRSARDEAERQGWGFADDGNVVHVPDEVALRFGGVTGRQAEEQPASAAPAAERAEEPPPTAMAAALQRAEAMAAENGASLLDKTEVPAEVVEAAAEAVGLENGTGLVDEVEAPAENGASLLDDVEAPAENEASLTEEKDAPAENGAGLPEETEPPVEMVGEAREEGGPASED